MDYALECERSRDEASGTKLWMTCDALVFVVSGEITSERAGATGPAVGRAEYRTDSGTKTNEKTTQCPEVGCYRRNQNASAVKTLRGTSVLKAIGEIAACVERMGEDDIFVVCERAGETDDVRGVNIRDALVKLTGVREDNVFCVKECGDEGLRDAGGGKLDESTGGWFNGEGGKKTVARDFQLRLENWHEKWSANRAKSSAKPNTIRFGSKYSFGPCFCARMMNLWPRSETRLQRNRPLKTSWKTRKTLGKKRRIHARSRACTRVDLSWRCINSSRQPSKASRWRVFPARRRWRGTTFKSILNPSARRS